MIIFAHLLREVLGAVCDLISLVHHKYNACKISALDDRIFTVRHPTHLLTFLLRLLKRGIDAFQAEWDGSDQIMRALLGGRFIILLSTLHVFCCWGVITISSEFRLLFIQFYLEFLRIYVLLFQEAISVLVVVPGKFLGDKVFVLNLCSPGLGLTKHHDGFNWL